MPLLMSVGGASAHAEDENPAKVARVEVPPSLPFVGGGMMAPNALGMAPQPMYTAMQPM